MAIKVLIVEDSRFFRRRIEEIVGADSRLEIIALAENGKEGVDLALKLKPDVITMDIEMPVMDGITAVKKIMAQQKIPILMFSTLTTEGAKATFDALDAGAADFIPKSFEDISSDREEAKRLLCQRIYELGRQGGRAALSSSTLKPSTAVVPTRRADPAPVQAATVSRPLPVRPSAGPSSYKLVAIGASTGGPAALQNVIKSLPSNFPLPVVVIQHMPAAFTGAFSERLNALCDINVRHIVDGEKLVAGSVYITPGGKQIQFEGDAQHPCVRVVDGDPEMIYKPCVDVAFRSISALFKGAVLSVILTGMGRDGCEGAKQLKSLGAVIWAQDEASCVVYGMPQAIVAAGIADRVMALDDIASHLAEVH